MAKELSFDSPAALDYNRVRQNFITDFLEAVRHQAELSSAADVGCGVGWLSKFLSDRSLKVLAVDGREENIAEARRRFPEIDFLTANAEDSTFQDIGSFDFVLCAGLLYHLENPFAAIRNLHAITDKVLLVESICAPGRRAVMDLLDEGHVENQGLNYVAFYPSELCLIKMLYRAGFPFVYHFQDLQLDQQYKATLWRKRSRAILAASKIELSVPNIVLEKEPVRFVPSPEDPWNTVASTMRNALGWDLWAEKLFNFRVLVAGWLRKFRGSVKSLPSNPRSESSGSDNGRDCVRMEK